MIGGWWPGESESALPRSGNMSLIVRVLPGSVFVDVDAIRISTRRHGVRFRAVWRLLAGVLVCMLYPRCSKHHTRQVVFGRGEGT